MRKCILLQFGWTDPLTGKYKKNFPHRFPRSLCILLKAGISSSLILSAWCVPGVKTALGGLHSPCVPMWRDREEDRTVDVTLGYDLNTCLLWLSSDQSSLCQAPLPAGNFSTHVTPSLTFFLLFLILYLSCSLFFYFVNFLSISWSLANLPSFDPLLGSCAMCYSFTLPRHAFPQCFLSHHLTRSPLLSACLRISRKEIRGVVVKERWKWMRDTLLRTLHGTQYKLFLCATTHSYFFHFCPAFNFLNNVVVFVNLCTHGLRLRGGRRG